MPKKLLDVPQIYTGFQQMGREGVYRKYTKVYDPNQVQTFRAFPLENINGEKINKDPLFVLVADCELFRFKEVMLDFKGIEIIGQALGNSP